MAAQLSGPASGSKFTIATNADMNVTPMVDVMLVLLIIFMVAAPVPTLSIKLDLPPATPNTIKPDKLPTVISLQKSGAIYVGQRESSVQRVAADFAAEVGGNDPQNQTVYIRSDKEVKYNSFMSVLNKLQENGFFKVSLILENLA